MRIVVDTGACAAHGECVVVAPDLFDLGDDDEVVRVLQEEPTDGFRDQARAAAEACPMGAISIEG